MSATAQNKFMETLSAQPKIIWRTSGKGSLWQGMRSQWQEFIFFGISFFYLLHEALPQYTVHDEGCTNKNSLCLRNVQWYDIQLIEPRNPRPSNPNVRVIYDELLCMSKMNVKPEHASKAQSSPE
jgi:hypothetical protein